MDIKSIDWKNVFFTFGGRVDRKVFWVFIAAVFVVGLIVAVLSVMLGDKIGSVLMLLINIPIVWAGLAVQIKRLHDLGKSGWFLLLSLIPLIGSLGLLIWLGFFEGESGPNQYGVVTTTI